MIERAPRILSEQWMLIGRQAHTPTGGRIDLLTIAPDASLVQIEQNQELCRTPRLAATDAHERPSDGG